MNDQTKKRLLGIQEENEGHKMILELHRDRFDKLRTRHEDGTAPQAVASFNLFQTPEPLAQRMADLAGILPSHSVLEPSAGLGRLLAPIYRATPRKVTGCEVSPDLCAEIYRTFPELKLVQGDFLCPEVQERIASHGPFDRIVMNPPFKMRADIRHIKAAMSHLAEGGKLVGLCLSGFKRPEFLEENRAAWETIPAGAFKSEGTNVETILFSVSA